MSSQIHPDPGHLAAASELASSAVMAVAEAPPVPIPPVKKVDVRETALLSQPKVEKRVAGVSTESPRLGGGRPDPPSIMPSESALNETEQQLEELQVATIYSLIEDVKVEVRGTDTWRKLLFLSNKQANKFNLDDLDKVLTAIDLTPRPRLIISLMESLPQPMVHLMGKCSYPTHDIDSILEHPYHLPELSWEDFVSKERDTADFLRNSIIPLAVKTNALVICNFDLCSLSKLFGEIVANEMPKMGGKLPFTVMSFLNACDLSGTSDRPGSVSYQIKHGSKRWLKRDALLKAVDVDVLGEERLNHLAVDVSPGCTHYIVVECVSKGKKDHSARDLLKNKFVMKLSETLPSIGIQTLRTHNFGALADYAGRGLPLLLIDSGYQRGHPSSTKGGMAGARDDIEEREALLVKEGKHEEFNMNVLARLCMGIRGEAGLAGKDGMKLVKGLALYEAVEVLGSTREMMAKTAAERGEAGQEAGVDGAVREAVEIYQQSREKGRQQLTKVSREGLARCSEMMNQASDLMEADAMLKQWTLTNFLQPMGKVGKQVVDALLAQQHLFSGAQEYRNGELWMVVPSVESGVSDLNEVKQAFAAIIQRVSDEVQEECDAGSHRSVLSMAEYMQVRDMLITPTVHAARMNQAQDLKELINEIARAERLPIQNSLEGTHIVRYAWLVLDIFNWYAGRFKWISKILFALSVLVSTSLSIVTVVALNRPDLIPKDSLRIIVLIHSVLGSILAATMTFVKPTLKWQQLRGSSLALESEIWKFRTRCSRYSLGGKAASSIYAKDTEGELLMVVEEVKQHTLKAASVMNTSLMSSFDYTSQPDGGGGHLQARAVPSRVNAGYLQVLGGRALQGRLPLAHQPDDYLQLRVYPQLAFYQGRMPRYSNLRTFFEASFTLFALSGTVFSTLDSQEWAAVVTAVAAGLTAWAEFSGTEKKLYRYSESASQVGSAVMWWNSLAEVDKASTVQISRLVETCETIFQTEGQSWSSATVLSKLSSGEGNDEEDG
eukprot:CAMPEP_0169426518 /NCGR_PEP_ID=MMETSP1042-20121227/250_1 /TAXON_ID=464988 /ORGANISM="Hemiselmis andersenii, Strain CCMP1180" /LENGTH=1005 /DNA_ID=CAMNT_0009536455 /DNA_START=113 /DNA_END=3128 /DNA_ORIENTATION=-